MNADAPSLSWLFFSFRGRVARQSFFLATVFLLLPQLVILLQIGRTDSSPGAQTFWLLMFFAAIIATLWSTFALAVKRLHDFGVTGWLAIVLLIPTASWIMLIALMLIPTKQETNEYGPPPFAK